MESYGDNAGVTNQEGAAEASKSQRMMMEEYKQDQRKGLDSEELENYDYADMAYDLWALFEWAGLIY